MIDTNGLQRIEVLFHEARALDPVDRCSFLDERCGADTALRVEVESLLAHADRRTEQLQPGGGAGDRAESLVLDRGPLSEGPGTWIGPYRILQKIGEGGFGVVYMAEQQTPVQRKVALKIIKLGMDTKQVIARFEAERQALALMDHPNIARVLEAGATETGRPYFVMELVKGIPLNEYCDRSRLSTDERLELFMQVCRAVQHAHQKGIIHRDLKPGNVLVTLHDTRPVPKVIDFGIAKATSRRLTERTLFTEFRQLIGTPEYMSPDQAEISGLDVDTRTDIYSLGVILYELLTGTTPFDSDAFRKAAYEEIQRIIREVDPPKPSTRLATLATTDAGAAVARGHHIADPSALRRLLRGDLDWIVMKAMEKDRARRYQSASELADDIERHRRNEPILASPPSVLYKLRKFGRRHRLGVTAGALIMAALLLGSSAATVGLVRARQEAVRSQRIADFLQELFISTNPEDAVAQNIDVDTVTATARDVFGDDHATVAATLSARALQLQSSGDLEAAERMYREALRLWRNQLGDDNANVGTTLSRLGLLLVTKGDDAAAEEALRESLRITGALPGAEGLMGCEARAMLAGMLVNRGAFDEAEDLLRESVRIRRAVAPHQRLQIAITVNSLTNVLAMSGRTEGMEEQVLETLEAWRDALPETGLFFGRVLTQIAGWFVAQEDREHAEPILREAVALFRENPEPVPTYALLADRMLFGMLVDDGASAEAIPLGLEAIELARSLDGKERLEKATRDLSDVIWDVARKPDGDEATYLAALDAVERLLAADPDDAAWLSTRGIIEYRLGRDEDALATLARASALHAQEHPGGVPADLAFTAMASHRLGRADEARTAMTALRAAMQTPELAGSADNQAHLAEAEAAVVVEGSDEAIMRE